MPSTLTSTVIVANLRSRERHLDGFEVECWNSARTTKIAGPFTVPASWRQQALKLNGNGAGSIAGPKQPVNTLISALTTYTVRARVKKSSGFTAGDFNIDLQGTGVNTTGLVVSAATLTTSYVWYEGSLATDTEITSVPGDLTIRVFIVNNPTAAQYVLVDEIVVLQGTTVIAVKNTGFDVWTGAVPIEWPTNVNSGGGTFSAEVTDVFPGSGTWVQTFPVFVKGLTKGTTYSFRSRVLLKAGGAPSAWSVWADETAGDTTAPAPTYTATREITAAGVIVRSTPSGAPTDLSHYEFHWNTTNTTPVSTTAPNLPESFNGEVMLVFGDAETAFLWVRAVDTSGNKQAWVSLSSFQTVGGGGNLSYRPKSNPLTAFDDGAQPQVDVAQFQMEITGFGTITYNAGSVDATSGDYDKTAFIYFDDAGYTNGGTRTVTFNITFSRETALTGTARFFVGSIPLPRSGGPAKSGNNDGGTGAQYSKQMRLLPVSFTADSWTNPANGIDDDDNNFAAATTSGANLTYLGYAFSVFTSWFSSIVLRVKHQFSVLAGSTTGVLEYSKDAGVSWTTARSVTSADASPVITEITLPLSVKTDKVQVRMVVPTGGSTNSAAYAGTGADDAAVGTTAWVTPTNAQGVSDAVNTTISSSVVAGNSVQSHYLKATNFSFSLASGSVISGIKVVVRKKGTFFEDIDGQRIVYDAVVKIVKGGTITGTDHADITTWSTVLTDFNYGGSADLWGTTWAYTDINASTFGVVISAYRDNTTLTSGTITGSIDSVQITVYYTSGTGNSTGKMYSISQVVSL